MRVFGHSLSAMFLLAIVALAPGRAAATTVGGDGKAGNTPGLAEYREALTALEKGDLASAESSFRRSLKIAPNQSGSYLGLAEVAARKKDTQAVLRIFDEAIAALPNSPDIRVALGRFQAINGNKEQAAKSFAGAIEANPHAPATYFAVAEAERTLMGQPEQAVATYRRVIELNPTHLEATLGMGRAFAMMKRNGLAEASFRRAAALKPESPEPLQALGELFTQLGRFPDALEAFDAAAKADPRYVAAYIGRADVFTLQKKYPQARAEADFALAIKPDYPEALLKRGVTFQMEGKLDLADEMYKKTIKIDPRQAIAYNNLAWMWSEHGGDLDECLDWAQRAVELAPAVSPLRDTLGWVHYKRGDLEKALSELELASGAPGADPGTGYRLGVVQDKLGQREAARKNIRAAIATGVEFDGLADAQRWLAANK